MLKEQGILSMEFLLNCATKLSNIKFQRLDIRTTNFMLVLFALFCYGNWKAVCKMKITIFLGNNAMYTDTYLPTLTSIQIVEQ